MLNYLRMDANMNIQFLAHLNGNDQSYNQRFALSMLWFISNEHENFTNMKRIIQYRLIWVLISIN